MGDVTLISGDDVTAAVERGIADFMSNPSNTGHHAREMESLLRQAFRKPNPGLVPMGVVMYYSFSVTDLRQAMTDKYPVVMAALALMPVKAELKKLTGVEAAFAEVDAEINS